MENHYSVYKLTDPDGKCYIGYTGQGLAMRFRKGYSPRRGCPIGLAIRKYGKDSIRKEVLASGLTRAEAERLEDHFIRLYDSMNPSKGYNRVTGGDRRGAHFSRETQQAISRSRRALFAGNPELVRLAKERRNAYFAAHPEAKLRVRETMQRSSTEGRNDAFLLSCKKPGPVLCVETGIAYRSRYEAEKLTGFTGIHKACSGRYTTSGGYHWKLL